MLFDQVVSRLRVALGQPGPTLVSAEGRLGLSPLPFVLEATRGRRRVVFAPPALTDVANRDALAVALASGEGLAVGGGLGVGGVPVPAGQGSRSSDEGTGQRAARRAVAPSDWRTLLEALPSMAPVVLVVDEPQGITAAHRRFWRDLGEAWRLVRRTGQRVQVVLCSCERGLGRELNRPASPLRRPAGRLAPAPEPDPVTVVTVEPGTHYDLAVAVPRWKGRDLLMGWALFGGLPETWRAAPGRRDPEGALRQAVTDSGGALGRWTAGNRWISGPWELLQQGVGKPNRYASVLSAVAKGARSWRELSEPAFQESGNRSGAGPYLARLRELGLVAADRPLGTRPGGRRSRYRLTDPHEAFWWSVVHPARSELLVPKRAAAVWEERVAPALDDVLARALPAICRNFLRFGAGLLLGATAREAGPLWGRGFDFPVAATLHNGAVCYGHVHHGPKPASMAELAELERRVRATRYGFARQARVRIVFSLTGFAPELHREAARNALVRLVGTEELAQGILSA